MAELTTKYLDLYGLGKFWTKVKGYITSEVDKINLTASNNDKALRSYIESLNVNGVTVTSNKTADTLGTALSVVINDSHINLTDASKAALAAGKLVAVDGKGADYEAATTVEGGLVQLDKRMDAVENVFQTGVVNTFAVEVAHDTAESDTAKEWITASASGATGAVKLTIDDTAIDSKFEAIDQDIATLTANAGVTEIKVVDTNATGVNYVDVSFVGNKEGYTEGYQRGQMTITVNETALDTKIGALDTVDANEETSRVADEILLAGAKFTPGVDGNTGSWAAEGSPKYKSITELSNRLATIDTNVVTSVAEGTSKETYVKLDVANSAQSGDSAVTITIDDDLLKQKVTALETADSTEATARKAHDKALGGADWTEGTGWVGTSTSYHDITTLGQHMKLAEDKIDALSTATHFIGVSSTEITNDGTQNPTIGGEVVTPASGDVVIYGHKEFIYSASKWVELGDTTTENARIGALEGWVDGSYITDDEIEAMFADGWTLPARPAAPSTEE